MIERARRYPDAVLLVLYALLAVAFFAPILGGRATLYFDDTNHFYYPARALVFGAYQRGLVPLWTDLIGAGYPILAEGQAGGLYPPNALLALLPSLPLALGWTVALHAWLAAALLHGFLRELGVRPKSAGVGAVAFMFSGAFVGHLVYVSMAFSLVWLPAVLWAVERGVRRRRWRVFALGGLPLALSLTAVHMQMAVYVALTALAYGLMRLVAVPPRERGRVVAGLGLLLGVGGLLAAGQLLPMVELALQSARGEAMAAGRLHQYGLTPMWLLYLFMPRFFGGAASDPRWADLTVPWEFAAYFSVPATVLALLSPLLSRRRVVWALAGIWWFTFLLAWGRALPFYGLLHSLPVMDAFRIPARWLMPGTVAGCALAALGADGLRREPAYALERLRRALPLSLLGFVCVMLFAWLPVDILRASGRIGPGEVTFAALAAAWFAALWLGTTVLLARGAGRRWLAPALAVLVAFDLFVAYRDFNPVAPPSVFEPDAAARRVAQRLAPGERVFVPPYTPEQPFLKPITNVLVGVPNVDTFLPLTLSHVDSLLGDWKRDGEPQATANRREQWLVAMRQALARRDARAAAVRERWLRRLRVRATLPRYGPVGAEAGEAGLYWLPGDVAPQAYVPATVVDSGAGKRPRAGHRSVEEWMLSAVAAAFVPDPPQGLPSTMPGAVRYEPVHPWREVAYPPMTGLVVVNGAAMPGWQAITNEGEALDTTIADGVFRAAYLWDIVERVTFVYAPITFRLGLFTALWTFALLIGAWVAGWGKR